jgi:hypothetical protein
MGDTVEQAVVKPAVTLPKEETYWGKVIVDILKKLLEINQLKYGGKRTF